MTETEALTAYQRALTAYREINRRHYSGQLGRARLAREGVKVFEAQEQLDRVRRGYAR